MAKKKLKSKKGFTKCKWCPNTELKFIPNYVHDSVETNEDVVHDVWKCEKCDSLYYFEDGNTISEHVTCINKISYDYKPQKSDYDIAVEKRQSLSTCSN